MVTSIGLCLAASRFGLAPSVKKVAAPSLKLSDRNMDLVTNDPAGFTAADTLAMGAAGERDSLGMLAMQGMSLIKISCYRTCYRSWHRPRTQGHRSPLIKIIARYSLLLQQLVIGRG